MTEAITIPEGEDFAVCSCGNDVMKDAFATVDANGNEVEPEVGGGWVGHLQCNACKAIANVLGGKENS